MAKAQENLIVGKHYPALDGLRGIAVLLVVIFHSSHFSYRMLGHDIIGFTKFYYFLSIIGETGVDLFFVLSGFLITGILIDTRNNEKCLKKFYIRRALRVFPLYFATLFIVFAFIMFFKNEDLSSLKILMHIFYIQNWSSNFNFDSFMYLNHTWSLAVEEQFYIFWPVLILFFYRKSPSSALLLCLSMVAISWVSRLYLTNIELHKLSYTNTISRVDTLCLGAFLSIYFSNYKKNIRPNFKILLYIMLAILALVMLCLFLSGNIANAHNNMLSYGTTLFAVFYTILLAYVFLSTSSSISNRFCSFILFQKIGRMSYGIYILHAPIMLILGKYLYEYRLGYWLNHILLLFVGGAISILLAQLSYTYFEKPIIKLKYKYADYNNHTKETTVK